MPKSPDRTALVAQLPPIESRRLYRQIADVIQQHLDDGVFPVGSLLPPERDLASQMRVSRTSIREALIALEVAGRVSVRVGLGVSVLPPPDAAGAVSAPAAVRALPGSPKATNEVGPLQVVEARAIVESATAELAAHSPTKRDLDELSRILVRLEAAMASEDDHAPVDFEFHRKIAQMSGNQALVLSVEQLWGLRASELGKRFEQHFVTGRLVSDTHRDHRRIFDAIKARDPQAARAAMKQHLDHVHKAYSIALA